MRNPLFKRLPREFRRDIGKYIVLFCFLAFLIALVAGYMVADGSMIKAYNESFEKYNIENGHFILDEKADRKTLRAVEAEGVRVEPMFYKDKVSKAGKTEGDEVRVYAVRDDMNTTALMGGRMPEAEDETVVDRLYAENNDLAPGDSIDVAGTAFQIVGVAAFSDYSALFKSPTDFMFDANGYTVAEVTQEAWDGLNKGGIKYCYAWRNDDQTLTDKQQRDKADDITDVLDDRNEEIDQVVARPDNPALMFTGEDMGGDMAMMKYLLYIVIVIIAFVYAISTRSTIEQEAQVIGTLRASGYTRKELLFHYITLPLVVTFLAAVTGNILGYTWMKKYMVAAYYHSYSLPPYVTVWNQDAFIMTTVVPCIIIVAVELVVITRALRHSPLKFLRKDLGADRKAGAIPLPSAWRFPDRFRARIILQNKSAYFTMFTGIFLASVLVFFGTFFSPMLAYFKGDIQQSKFANYQYILKDLDIISYEDAEKYAMEAVKNDNGEDISVYGVIHNSDFFDGDLREGTVLVSSAYAEKYGVCAGDRLTLYEKFGSDEYTLNVGGIYDYPASLCVFMYIDEFNDVFDYDTGYFCGYFSDKELDIDEEAVSSVITEKDMTVISDQLEDSMGSIFPLFTYFAVILYILLIYLLAKITIDRNTYSISMTKILGYNDREISHLYSRATAVVVVISILISMLIAGVVMKILYHMLMMEYNGWMTYYASPRCYINILVIGLACYFLVSRILMRRIRKIPMAEALKGLE